MSDCVENMDHNTKFCDHTNDIEIDEVYDELDKLIDSVETEERELLMKIENVENSNGINEKVLESNGLVDPKSEDKEIKKQLFEKNFKNDGKKSDEENNHFEYKDNQNNSEDGKEELELSEMIVCDEVTGDTDDDENKIDVGTTVTDDKDKYEKDNKKLKKESKEKESNKKKYDKKSDSKSKDRSKKEDFKRNDKKRSRTPSKERSSKDSSLKKRTKTIDKEKESKKLRELDKFWQTVRDDPSDFIGWTYLLQYVDTAKNIEAAREAYDAFLDLYPYCYGYWRKYADYERKNGTKENCEKVFDRGLKAIPLSVDLWIHYMGYMKSAYPDDEEMIREQFERAVDACGIEFRSDRLWDHYIKFELDCKQYIRVTDIYERLIATPTHGYLNNFDCFKDYIKKYPKNKILETVKFLELRKEVLAEIKETDAKKNQRKIDSGSDSDDLADPMEQRTKEENLMKEKMIASRIAVHKSTAEMVALRLPYEEMIKRPYFHVKPLERSQIRNWKEYLEFEISQGVYKRIVVLFERCLIACALYEEFWTKYINYLESLESNDQEVTNRIEDIYIRACTVHHKNKPTINLTWALYLESKGQFEKAAQILDMLDSVAPHKKLIIQRRINLERRRKCYDRVCELYEHYISTSNTPLNSILLTIKYSRFVWKILKNADKASNILSAEIGKINNVQKSSRLLLQLIEIKMSDNPVNVDDIVKLFDSIINMKSIDIDQQVIFAQRKVEFLEEFGSNIFMINQAIAELAKYLKISNDREKKPLESVENSCSIQT
ncbi:Tetratricopeptide-like helical domain,HAT (Half-A-TPR) repeat [Cinara cedri]|uniref:Tetratricopeptide-like helical domain,HAT (Half-A-TPR) repeat n=1 Tax=Cinara cedri TaxID=506608 RepID=A0A5E4MH88_9HEMI|nr:Tetratricopeptide-like helical domain,HAT (Half-A-TPR) repeat [Cinara cedri]